MYNLYVPRAVLNILATRAFTECGIRHTPPTPANVSTGERACHPFELPVHFGFAPDGRTALKTVGGAGRCRASSTRWMLSIYQAASEAATLRWPGRAALRAVFHTDIAGFQWASSGPRRVVPYIARRVQVRTNGPAGQLGRSRDSTACQMRRAGGSPFFIPSPFPPPSVHPCRRRIPPPAERASLPPARSLPRSHRSTNSLTLFPPSIASFGVRLARSLAPSFLLSLSSVLYLSCSQPLRPRSPGAHHLVHVEVATAKLRVRVGQPAGSARLHAV